MEQLKVSLKIQYKVKALSKGINIKGEQYENIYLKTKPSWQPTDTSKNCRRQL